MRRGLAIIMSVSVVSVLAACSGGNSQEAEVKAWAKEVLELSRESLTDAEYEEKLDAIDAMTCEDPVEDEFTCTVGSGESFDFGINDAGEVTAGGMSLDENLQLMKDTVQEMEYQDNPDDMVIETYELP